ncbi:MAG TPA: hypothetical protein ENJ56_04405 [Anaerolineae bacterium]|nr:hypothetical protein [Anaerolineae bacterium]
MLRKLLIGTVSLFALFAVGGAALFFAEPSAAAQIDTVDATIWQGDEVAAHPQGRPDGGRRHGKPHGVLTPDEKATVIAETLGITVEEVKAAHEDGVRLPDLAEENGVEMDVVADALYTAAVDKVNTMLADGDITQEEADKILEKIELRKLAYQVFDREVLKQAVADTLGVTVDELEAAHEDGTVAELADAAGVTRADVKEAVEAARNGLIDDALANGEITTEQAEQLRQLPIRRPGHGGHNGNGRPRIGKGVFRFNGNEYGVLVAKR